MLWTIAFAMILFWLFGILTGNTMGNYIHILIVFAIIAVVIQGMQK